MSVQLGRTPGAAPAGSGDLFQGSISIPFWPPSGPPPPLLARVLCHHGNNDISVGRGRSLPGSIFSSEGSERVRGGDGSKWGGRGGRLSQSDLNSTENHMRHGAASHISYAHVCFCVIIKLQARERGGRGLRWQLIGREISAASRCHGSGRDHVVVSGCSRWRVCQQLLKLLNLKCSSV